MKIVVLKVNEQFTQEQLKAMANEEPESITITGEVEAVYFDAQDYYDIVEAARIFDAQMQAGDDE